MEEKKDKFAGLRNKEGIIILHDSKAEEEENNYKESSSDFEGDPLEFLKEFQKKHEYKADD